jgi:hypothetical protein
MNYVDNHCDGSGPHTGGEVRVLPYGGGGNLILCYSCYRKEIRYRMSFVAREFDLPGWKDLEIYGSE